MMDKIFELVKENKTHPLALFGGVILLWASLIFIDRFLNLFILNPLIRLSIYIFLTLVWVFIWWRIRVYLPVNKKGYIGLIIAIRTENNKQKIRLKNDFTRKIKELVKDKGLSDTINIIFLNQLHTSKLTSCIDKGFSKDNKRWIKIRNKVKGHFYIYGDIKERKDVEEKYFLNLEAFVLHPPLQNQNHSRIKLDFMSIWAKKISFLEKLEFKGFEFSAELVFLAVLYITGLAALFSGDYFLAYELHKNLKTEFNKITPLPPNLVKIKKQLSVLLAEECFLIARYKYDIDADLKSAETYLTKSLNYTNKNYGGFLLKAIIEFLSYSDPKKALSTINRAKSYSREDGTWRYSQAFLLMHLEDFDKGVMAYDKIIKNSYYGEPYTLYQVYEFNRKFLENNPSHLQSLFIIGYLKYKKEKNYPEALGYFEKFKKDAIGKDKFNYLIKKCESCLVELNTYMKLNN